ncbi:TlpA disulfide reductase family protein [Mucilaginibacter sp.]|uniref:TlpA family protein disulfide reductase n=1 Tax=Mucilaginibacter sp. TaxID=1882438 RepID=UPI0025D762CD|nr:TlpA disulfide reductase family protein [Mucilaginibacter sp.]
MPVNICKFKALFLVSLFFPGALFAQKTFNVTIELDSSVNPKNVHYQYDNGKSTIFVPDTFGNNRTIVLRGSYYSPYAALNVNYSDSTKNYFGNDFFLTEKPARINFYFKPNMDSSLDYSHVENAVRVYDTVDNKILLNLWAFTKKEGMVLGAFFNQNKAALGRNDSIKLEFVKLYKARVKRAMLFFQNYPGDYFSFWYFRNQLVQLPNGYLNRDTAFLKEQLVYFNTIFPAKFTKSIEGQNLKEIFDAVLSPVKTGEMAPAFSLIDLDGRKIDLPALKGKYVLLDFWATWCGPCMAEIPFIKEIRKKYPAGKLVIIGMSQDRNKKAFADAIKKEGMNWLHFFDSEGDISRLYGVNYFPTLILINPIGKIIYLSDGKLEDKDALRPVLTRFLD